VRIAVLALCIAGCAELGVVSDGTSISVGKASKGYLVDGARLPDSGDGFTTRDVWKARGNRYGTDELVDLVTNVARRMSKHVKETRLVVADLSGVGGTGGNEFHRSHQSGRDVDLLYYMRAPDGSPFEPDAMHEFGPSGVARDGSGIKVDVPRTWLLVKELVDAPEAPVQYVFMYEPLAQMLLEHAQKIGEPADLIARARMMLKQPGDSAKHDDHMHVRVYCSESDKQYGCVDYGPMELLAIHQARESELYPVVARVSPPPMSTPEVVVETAAAAPMSLPTAVTPALASTPAPAALQTLLRARVDRIQLRWH
jgi:penicillin-insensitive murein endopeptidase